MEMVPEDELCVLLARRQLSAEARKRALRLITGSLSWPRFLERGRGYEILPLLFGGLRALDFQGVPDPVRTELTNIFRVNAMRNEFLAQELTRLLRLLGDAGIPVIPLKGIPQATSLYDDPALRDCSDIDVLVPRRRVIEAFHLVVSAGYEPLFPQPALVGLRARFGKDYVLTREDRINRYVLDLHCGLLWGGELERGLLEEIWADACQKTFYDVPAFTLNPDWEFLYLAVHAFKHGRSSLKYLVDLDRFCFRQAVNWYGVQQKAKRLGWEKAVWSCLSDCVSLFDTPVSSVLYSTDAARKPGAISVGESEMPGDILSLQLLKSPSEKLRFLAIRFFIPSPDTCEQFPLPPSLFFVYYALQPLRIFAKTFAWSLKARLSGVSRT